MWNTMLMFTFLLHFMDLDTLEFCYDVPLVMCLYLNLLNSKLDIYAHNFMLFSCISST